MMSLLTAGIPLTLLLDLAAGEALDSAEILAVEAATAMVRSERARAEAERGPAKRGKGKRDIA